MRTSRFAPLLAALVVLPAAIVAGCGSDEGSGSLAMPAPAASEFPPASGRDAVKFLEKTADAQGPVASPAGKVFRLGENRFPFGVYTAGRDEIDDAQVAVYASHGKNGKVEGPFPARIEDLTVEARYRSETTASDPDSARVAYVTDIPFDRKGEWRLGALIKQGESLQGTLMPSAVVGPYDDVPTVGEVPPRIHTPTAEDVGGDLAKIDTRQPPDDMHSVDFADALGERPMVLLFATPALCVSRVCGPVVDIAEQVKHTDGEGVDFIHMEVYKDNKPSKSLKGLRPQLRAFNLPTEPWLFAVNREGRIAAVLQGPFSVAELSEAVKRARG